MTENPIAGRVATWALLGTSPLLADRPTAQWEGGVYASNLSEWQREALKQIYKIKTLPRDWDNEGGLPPNEAVVNTAISLLCALPFEDLPIPFVVPTSSGGLQFEWSIGQRVVELGIRLDCSLEYL